MLAVSSELATRTRTRRRAVLPTSFLSVADPLDSALAGAPSSLPFALHAHRVVVDQPGRALVRYPDGTPTAPRSPSQHPRTGTSSAALRSRSSADRPHSLPGSRCG